MRGSARKLLKQLAWFAGLWAAGVGAIAVVAFVIRSFAQ